MWLIIFTFFIIRTILCDSYTATIDLGTGEISKIYSQFVNDNFASTYFDCDPYKQINKTVSNCTYNEPICHAPKVNVSGICDALCNIYITSNNSIINNTFVPINILEQIVATKVINKDYFQFSVSTRETDFYVYVINQNSARENKLTITYNCANPVTSYVIQDNKLLIQVIVIGGLAVVVMYYWVYIFLPIWFCLGLIGAKQKAVWAKRRIVAY
uniref:Transmembrane protein n=1 Tax=Mimivirus LCMiAC01 TaxID=2506608 RepID=A0A481Z060_9VIRU|nr:MAG: hypothetical protein LCMiAC01_02180 [Mimivirus LCMiAC01]